MKTITSIKLDAEVKQKAKKLAEGLGLNLSMLINAQLKQFIRDKKLILVEAPQMSTFLEELLGPVERDLKQNKNLSKSIRSKKELDQLFDDL